MLFCVYCVFSINLKIFFIIFSNSGAGAMRSVDASGVVPHFADIESDGSRVEDGLLSSECDTPMYEKPEFTHYFRQDSADKHVQFDVGK